MDILHKSPVQYTKILQFMIQRPAGSGILGQLLHLLQADTVLHKLGYGRLHLMNIADLMQMGSHHLKLPLTLLRHLAQHQAFARIIKHRHILTAHLLQNTVRQSAKAQNVNVHDDMAGMLHHQIHLRLHGKLIRHDEQIVRLRMPLRCLYDIFMQPPALAGAGCPEIKLK